MHWYGGRLVFPLALRHRGTHARDVVVSAGTCSICTDHTPDQAVLYPDGDNGIEDSFAVLQSGYESVIVQLGLTVCKTKLNVRETKE